MKFWYAIGAAGLVGLPGLAQAVDFATEVHPILASRCDVCHSGAKPAGGLSLASRALALSGGASGPAIEPGNGAESLLIQKVSGKKGATMPAGGEPLSATQIATLRAWIDQGANWPRGKVAPGGASKSAHWSFQPIRRPALPLESATLRAPARTQTRSAGAS